MLNRPTRIARLGLWLVVWAAVCSAAAWAAQRDEPAAPQRTASELVERLGDPVFAVRQRAARDLLRLGAAAEKDLEAALEHPDAEVRQRAASLLEQVLETGSEAKLAAFLGDAQGAKQLDLPGWQKFRELVGDSRASRTVFVAMQRAEPKLLAAYQAAPRRAAEVSREAAQVWASVEVEADDIDREQLFGDLAAVLFVGGDKDVSLDAQYVERAWQFGRVGLNEELRNPETAPVLRKLLGRWVLRDSGANWSNLSMAASYALPEGAELARRLLAEPQTPPAYRGYAALVLGRLGAAGDVTVLEKLLDDKSLCHQQQLNFQRVETQVRDAALAAMVRLTGQKVADYGFDRAVEHEQYLYQLQTLGFRDAAKRDAALKKWADHRAAKKSGG
jgi:hypothetical protein